LAPGLDANLPGTHARAAPLVARVRRAALCWSSGAHGWPRPIGSGASLVLRVPCFQLLARTAFEYARIGIGPVALVDWRLQSHRRLPQRHMVGSGCLCAPRSTPAFRPRHTHAALLACDFACRLSSALAARSGALLLGEDGAFLATGQFRSRAIGASEGCVTISPFTSNTTVGLQLGFVGRHKGPPIRRRLTT